jgi:dTDP-4-dehydrorhamnose reductase
MIALVTGAGGQLGRAMIDTVPTGVTLHALERHQLDLADADAIRRVVAELSPDLIINAAAYTAVDAAEGDEARAHQINALAVGHLADAARGCGARLIHISTDFVFDGRASAPYLPDAPTNPLGAYGRSKLAGELAAGPDALIIRTAWVYSIYGANFVKTMLRLMRERDEVRVVADQIGTPTSASSLARAIWALSKTDASGVHHFTDGGQASWHDFAVAIRDEALALGLLSKSVPVTAITTADYPTPARRPAYSILDTRATDALIGAPATPWRTNLRHMLETMKSNG